MKKQIKHFGLFSAVIVVLYSCSQYQTRIENEVQVNNDEKYLYKEIFFGSAEESKLTHTKDLIAIRQEMSDETVKDLEEIEAVLTGAIEKINPGFYEEFNRNIRSGDHILIEQALEQGGQMLEKSLYATPELAEKVLLGEKIAKEVDINKFVKDDGTVDALALNKYIEDNYREDLLLVSPAFIALAAFVVVAISVAVAVNYAAAMNIYAAINAWTKVNVPPKKSQHSSKVAPAESNLQLEMLINDIAILYKKDESKGL